MLPLADGYDFYHSNLLDLIRDYNLSVQEFHQFKDAASRSETEFTFGLLAPYLIALALALRMTKVTAELRDEDKKHMEKSLARV